MQGLTVEKQGPRLHMYVVLTQENKTCLGRNDPLSSRPFFFLNELCTECLVYGIQERKAFSSIHMKHCGKSQVEGPKD